MRFLTLLKMLILRNIMENRGMTLLSILGVALGIGLFTGVKVASDRAITSFEADVRGIYQGANFEISGASGIDFDEEAYKDVHMIETRSIPVLKTPGYVPSLKDAIDINGIYTVKGRQFLGLAESSTGGIDPQAGDLSQNVFTGYDFENFYTQPNAILITRKFAERHGLQRGDRIRALVYDRNYELLITGILDVSLPSGLVVMDLGNFQEYFGKTGLLSRIDLATEKTKAEAIRRVLPEGLKIEEKEEIFGNRKAMIASFRYNLRFVSLVAVLAGIFLLYNTIFVSVVKRRPEIGVLRGIGASKKTIVFLFMTQGMILGMAGSLFGIALGQITAYFSVVAVEKTISTLYSPVRIPEYLITGKDILAALFTGIAVSILASAIPSFEASTIRPNETSREGSFEGRYLKYRSGILIIGILSFFSGIGLAYIDYRMTPFEFPVFAYAGILCIIIGFTLASPSFLALCLKLLKKPLRRAFGPSGSIAEGDMKGNLYRFSIALMSVAVSAALIVSLLTLIFSLRSSLVEWIDRNITADVYIKPAACSSNYCYFPMSRAVIDIVRSSRGVAGVDEFRGMEVDLYGSKVVVAFGDAGVKRQFLEERDGDRGYREVLKEMDGYEAVAGISQYLANRYHLKVGDTIQIPSPSGNVSFRVNDISSNYATTTGFIYIDRKWLKKYWGRDDATQISVYLNEQVDTDTFIRDLRTRLPSHYALEIMNNGELRTRIMDIFHRTFAITYAIESISILVSLIGVINIFLAFVIERKREISILRYLGSAWGQIAKTLMISSSILGATGIIFGSLLGLVMSWILIYSVNKVSFGWEIQFRMPFLALSGVAFALFLTTVFAGFLPMRVVRRIDPGRFVSFE